MYYIYNKETKVFLSREFDDLDKALEYIYLIGGRYNNLVLIQNKTRVLKTGFIAATYTRNYYGGQLAIFSIDSDRKEYGELKRWGKNIFPKVGDVIKLYDNRKTPKRIVGFGEKSVISFRGLEYQTVPKENYTVNERSNKTYCNKYGVVFLMDKYGRISTTTAGEIYKVLGSDWNV